MGKKVEEDNQKVTDRRRMLKLLGIGAVGFLQACSSNVVKKTVVDGCFEVSDITRGPFFVDAVEDPHNTATGPVKYRVDPNVPNRSDIRSDSSGKAGIQAGIPLTLEITVKEENCGKVIPNVRVDIWQCNAAGVYSDIQDGMNDNGNNHLGENFLRGYQMTDKDGKVIFTTIYPGAYTGRTVHIHLKLRLFNEKNECTTEHTTQVFFSDEITNKILAEKKDIYSNKMHDTTNKTDMHLKGQNPELIPELKGDIESGLKTNFTLSMKSGEIKAGN